MEEQSLPPSTLPTWINSGTLVRLWLSYWPLMEPAIHTLKLTVVRIQEYGLQFEANHRVPPGTTLQIRLLLPPMTAIAVQGVVVHEESSVRNQARHFISVRFTTIRESDRRRLNQYVSEQKDVRNQPKPMTVQ